MCIIIIPGVIFIFFTLFIFKLNSLCCPPALMTALTFKLKLLVIIILPLHSSQLTL